MAENQTPNNADAFDATEIYKDGTYLQNNESWHAEDSPWKASKVRQIFKANGISPKTVCEVGCGAGEIIKELSASYPDTDFVGYELSPQAFELCKTHETNRVTFRLASILDEDIFFDSLLCIDVFEHVEDYMGFIKALKAKANYKVFHIPLDISVLSILSSSIISARQSSGHLHYFTKDTALATLRDCGHDIIDFFYTTSSISLPNKSFKTIIANIPRRLMFALFPHITVKLFGGFSLMVLTK